MEKQRQIDLAADLFNEKHQTQKYLWIQNLYSSYTSRSWQKLKTNFLKDHYNFIYLVYDITFTTANKSGCLQLK